MNYHGVIDVVYSDDVDTLVFGAFEVIRNMRVNKMNSWCCSLTQCFRPSPPSVNGETVKRPKFGDKVQHYTSSTIYRECGITHSGLVLIALLCGGDYDKVSLCIRLPNDTSADCLCSMGSRAVVPSSPFV